MVVLHPTRMLFRGEEDNFVDFTNFCQRQNFLSLTMIQPPVVSSVVVVVVVVGVVGVSVQIKNGITF